MSGVHVTPIDDLVEHDPDGVDCVCEPRVEWVDPATGDTYPAGPLVVHEALDGRD